VRLGLADLAPSEATGRAESTMASRPVAANYSAAARKPSRRGRPLISRRPVTTTIKRG